jgi:hypothetical protein
VFRSAYRVDTITDFTAEDRLHVTRQINGLTGLTVEGLIDRLSDTAAGAFLDLGKGNGVVFADLGADVVGVYLEAAVTLI